ncbi:hypothetical protein PVAP13_3KG122918, partial [Panicum virgatum]
CCGGGGTGTAAAAIRILSELLSFTASSYLVPSLNTASTRSEGSMFHSHLENSNFCLWECKLFLHCGEGMLLTLIRHATHFSK